MLPSFYYPPHSNEFHERETKYSEVIYSTDHLLQGNDDSQNEEEILIALKKNVESNAITFSDKTYGTIFDRLRAVLSCLDDNGLEFCQKRRLLGKGRAFCQAVLTSEIKNELLLTKHVQRFSDILLQTAMENENESCSELLSPWFSLLCCHVSGIAKRNLDNVTVLLAEMIVGERSDSGLEHLLFHLNEFLDLSSSHVGDLAYFTLLISRLLVPLYRLRCFYLSPKYKSRQNRHDQRPILLRSRLHQVLAHCILKFPETSDTLVNSLFRLWDCCRHLKVNPINEEVDSVAAALVSYDTCLNEMDKIAIVKLKLMSSFKHGIRMKKRRIKERRKRVDSLKRYFLNNQYSIDNSS